MSFLDRVIIPDTQLPRPRERTGGFLGRVSLPKDQARATEVFNLRQESARAIEEAEALGSFGGIVKETVSGVFSPLRSAIEGFKSVPKTEDRTFRFEVGVEKGWDVLASTIQDAGDRISSVAPTFKDEQATSLEKGVAVGKAGLGIINSLFTPITVPLTVAETVPAIGVAVDVINRLFGAIGEGSAEVGSKMVDSLPISDKSKETLRPLVEETAALVGQIILGKKGAELINKVTSNTKTITDVTATAIKERAVETSSPKVKGGFLEKAQKEKAVTKEVAKDVVPEAPRVILEKPVGRKPSKVGLSIEQRAIERKLTDSFQGTAGFDPITIKKQAQLVSDLIATDLKRAERMIKGQEPVPAELRGSSLIVGLEEYALKRGNVEMLRDLAKSPLTSETSRFAQELRILGERSPESPVTAMRDVAKAREASFENRTRQKPQKVKETEVKKMKAEIEKTASRPTWEEFIKEIRCNF